MSKQETPLAKCFTLSNTPRLEELCEARKRKPSLRHPEHRVRKAKNPPEIPGGLFRVPMMKLVPAAVRDGTAASMGASATAAATAPATSTSASTAMVSATATGATAPAAVSPAAAAAAAAATTTPTGATTPAAVSAAAGSTAAIAMALRALGAT